MKTRNDIISFTILLLLSFSMLAQDWECKDCPKRKIGLFDLDVWVKNPANNPSDISQSDWAEMFMVAGGIHHALFNNDPSRECLNYYDGQMAVIADLDEQNYQYGNTDTSLPPPSGTMDGVDYLVSGIISNQKSDGTTIIKAFVQTSGTGETVVEATMPYDFSISGIQNGKNITQQLTPLMSKIRAFEKKKRNEDQEVCIDPEGKGASIEINPEKEIIKVGETVNVKIKLIDCDGNPIKNMKVKLSPKGGRFEPKKLSTNDSGEAETKFIADCDPGVFMQVLEFEHRFPYSFNKNTSGGDEDFEIEAGNKFQLVYKHTSKQEYGGAFLLQSTGKGEIPCTINWDSKPPTIKGSGKVNATWSGNADQCKFVGNSSFSLDFKGEIIYDKTGLAQIKLIKTADSPLGGEFKIICGTVTQTVPESMPIPALEEDRVLIFKFTDGDTNAFDVPETDTHYSYQIKLKCK